LSEERRLCIRISITGNQASSLLNFRGPLISYLAAKGHEVSALAPDYDESTRAAVRALGASPVDYSLSRSGMSPFRDAADMLCLITLFEPTERRYDPGVRPQARDLRDAGRLAGAGAACDGAVHTAARADRENGPGQQANLQKSVSMFARSFIVRIKY